MKRLLAYLFIVLGLGLTFSVNSYSAVYCVDNKINERIANFKPDYPNRENEFFYFSAQSGTCIGSYTQVTFEQYNYFKQKPSQIKIKGETIKPANFESNRNARIFVNNNIDLPHGSNNNKQIILIMAHGSYCEYEKYRESL